MKFLRDLILSSLERESNEAPGLPPFSLIIFNPFPLQILPSKKELRPNKQKIRRPFYPL